MAELERPGTTGVRADRSAGEVTEREGRAISLVEPAEFFDRAATRYDCAYDSHGADGHAVRARMDAVVRLLGPGPGDVLDAGAGPGRLCVELDRLGWRVSGVDAAPAMVEVASARVPSARERFVCAPIEAIPLPDASFDAVVATGVLEYAETAAALRELARVLRPAGRAIVSYPNILAIHALWRHRVFYPAVSVVKRAMGLPPVALPTRSGAIHPRRFLSLLADSGLEVEEMVYASFVPALSPSDLLLPATTARLGARLEGSGARLGRRLATQLVFGARKP